MPARLQDKVAFITGAARGQGRSHAVRLAQEGADIIAVDLCQPVATAPYELAGPDDLARTVEEVEALGRRIVACQADVRDLGALQRAVDDGVAALGRLDIVAANAGIVSYGTLDAIDEQTWQEMIDINLSGVWRTIRAALPHIRAGGRGGSIIITSSTAGLMAYPGIGHYTAAKHGLLGLMRTLALELGPEMIRVNSVHPTSVNTDMVNNDATYKLFVPGVETPTTEQFMSASTGIQALPIPWVEPADVSNAVLFLASDEARYLTGVALPVDAGTVIK